MKTVLFLFFILVNIVFTKVTPTLQKAAPTYTIKFIGHKQKNGNLKCEILKEGICQINRLVNKEGNDEKNLEEIIVLKHPSVIEHLQEQTSPYVYEIFGTNRAKVQLRFRKVCQASFKTPEEKNSKKQDEVFKLSGTGPSNNRIDIVFMGDGYRRVEKQKFLDDMKRLHGDMFSGITFRNYLPLFNVWAVYRESQESGIGVHSTPRNTAYRLYRQGTQLRGVFCGNQRAARASCRATGANGCDFPTLIGNDPYYGGLGGEFAISTSSKTSGTKVLRHEFGHNLGRVGEEYDVPSRGAYFGANFASSLFQARSKWSKWVTGGTIVGQQSQIRINAYPWYDLARGTLNLNFRSNGAFKRTFLRFSVSGVETQDSLIVELDGKKLDWKTSGNFDRSFSTFKNDAGFSNGAHVLSFRQGVPSRSGDIRQVCNVGLIEYQDDDKYRWDNKYINAYPNFAGNSINGYRSNNELCLMRNMTSPHFCDVCKENLWLQFFSKMNAIDDLIAQNLSGGQVKISVVMVKIAQFRDTKVDGELFTIEWIKNRRAQPQFSNKFEFTLSESESKGSWRANVKFTTPEIRNDPRSLTSFTRLITIR